MRRWLTVLLALLLAGCAGRGEPPLPPPSLADDPRAAAALRALEEELRALAALPPGERRAAQRAFRPRLEEALARCRGTRHENKPLYWLCDWLLAFGDEDGLHAALRHLERLDILPAPAFRNAGRDLRVTALLRLGRLEEARRLAVALDASVPEFGAGARVALHARAGQPAPPLPGRPLRTAPQPAAGPLLLLIIPALQPAAEDWLADMLAAAPTLPRSVLVVGGDPLAAAQLTVEAELRWAAADDPALAAWALPYLPVSFMLDAAGQRVLAVDPPPWRLRRLAQP